MDQAPQQYHALDTPNPLSVHSDSTRSVATKTNFGWVVAHWFVGLCILLAAWTPFQYFLPYYKPEISTPIGRWWGVDPKKRGSGHSEMVFPTMFFVFMVLPMIVGALVFAVVRSKSPLVVPPFSHYLHAKPKFIFRCLVSYGELLFLAIVLGGNAIVFYYFFNARYNPKKATTNRTLDLIALTLGFNGLFNMAFLALPATRHCFWMEWLNIPYAHGIKYHRWLGVATIVAIGAHTVFYIITYYRTNELMDLLPCFNCDIADEGFHNWMNTFGILSYLSMLAIAVTSLPFFRRKYYNIFYVTHFLFIPAAFFAIMHWGPIMYWLYATIVLYLVNRMFSSASICTPVSLDRAIAMPSQVVELTLHCATGYSPGDCVWIKVPALSKTQWHPFSVASTPLHTPGLLTVYIKCLGKWSDRLYHYIKKCNADGTTPIVYMDGGYTPAAPIPSAHSDVVFVGGGIGVTPLMGQLLHILYTNPHQTVWLIWHVRRSDMLLQFRDWLKQVEALAASSGNRVHLRLHVTQENAASFDFDDETDDARFASTPLLEVDATAVTPRPYAHLSTGRRMLLLVAAFACSGAMLMTIKYGNRITTANEKLWPLQRFMEFILVVVGSYMAYVVTYIKKTPVPDHPRDDVDATTTTALTKKDMDIPAFLAHYNVQFQRAVWPDMFAEIESTVPTGATVGVYVSGPKALVRTIDFQVQGKAMYHAHNEEFDM
ncbi:Aste57867_22116 [Aphanomyces stellatus]|uniref:Aste57867_22116 protein n=1 Tax=Aphanomyces stellatus TaxID=120398 RepID=A0A485LJC0_9STRA|nr:hypothetical protein As57867_022047 [Aphanomyces stellatus]VFT98784.1 Aste57867_22116 [Aphanomyces stellatus]